MAKVKDSDEENLTYEYDSDSDRADPFELYDSDGEDGPLIQRMDQSDNFCAIPSLETVLDFLVDTADWFRTSPRLRKIILRHRHHSQDNRICWAHEELEVYGRNLEVWYLRNGTCCDHDIDIVPADEPFISQDRMHWRVGDRQMESEHRHAGGAASCCRAQRQILLSKIYLQPRWRRCDLAI